MKFALNPQYTMGAAASAPVPAFATLAALLAFHVESKTISLAYIAQRLSITQAAALIACTAAGVTVTDDGQP